MEDRWGWIAAAGALLAPLGAAVANRWRHKDDREKREGDWRERSHQSLFDQQSAQLQAAYKRAAELEAELARVEADRDRGWDVARAWNNKAHELNHVLNNALLHVPEATRPAPYALPTFQGIAGVGEGKER